VGGGARSCSRGSVRGTGQGDSSRRNSSRILGGASPMMPSSSAVPTASSMMPGTRGPLGGVAAAIMSGSFGGSWTAGVGPQSDGSAGGESSHHGEKSDDAAGVRGSATQSLHTKRRSLEAAGVRFSPAHRSHSGKGWGPDLVVPSEAAAAADLEADVEVGSIFSAVMVRPEACSGE